MIRSCRPLYGMLSDILSPWPLRECVKWRDLSMRRHSYSTPRLQIMFPNCARNEEMTGVATRGEEGDLCENERRFRSPGGLSRCEERGGDWISPLSTSATEWFRARKRSELGGVRDQMPLGGKKLLRNERNSPLSMYLEDRQGKTSPKIRRSNETYSKTVLPQVSVCWKRRLCWVGISLFMIRYFDLLCQKIMQLSRLGQCKDLWSCWSVVCEK